MLLPPGGAISRQAIDDPSTRDRSNFTCGLVTSGGQSGLKPVFHHTGLATQMFYRLVLLGTRLGSRFCTEHGMRDGAASYCCTKPAGSLLPQHLPGSLTLVPGWQSWRSQSELGLCPYGQSLGLLV